MPPQVTDPRHVSAALDARQRRGRAVPGGADFDLLDQWSLLARPRPWWRPLTAAVERHFDAGWSLAWVWPLPSGFLVAVDPVDSLDDAGRLVASARVAHVVVGKSVARDPSIRHAFRGLPLTSKGATSTSAVDGVRSLVWRELLLHDGGEHLTDQLSVLVASPAREQRDVPRPERARADAVKAAVWAAQHAQALVEERPSIY
jgi:hypothetical protein